MVRLRIILIGILIASGITSDVFAGVVKVSCDPGSNVSLFVRRMNGTTDPQEFKNDANNDGIVEFGVANQATVKNLFICKQSDAMRIWYEINIVVGGATLASLEPFNLPTFASVNAAQTLFASVDAEDFLNAGNPFTVGQITNAIGGSISETATITFKDGTSLAPDPDWNVVDPATLPDFAGDIEVMPFDSFDVVAIPTMSEWGLSAMTLLLMVTATILFRQQR